MTSETRPQDWFGAFFGAHHLPMLLMDATGALRQANPSAQALFGLSGAPENLHLDEVLRLKGHGGLHVRLSVNLNEPREYNFLTDQGDLRAEVVSHRLGPDDFCLTCRPKSPGIERFKNLFEKALEGIFVTTPQGKYIDVNPALAEMYGFPSPESLIAHFSDIKAQLYVDPGRRDDFVRLMDEYEEVWNFESRILRRDGTIIWISENAWAVHDAAGQIDYYQGMVIDITEQKQVQNELAEQQARLRQLFDNSPQAIMLIDNKRRLLEANQAFESLFGFRKDEISKASPREYIVSDELRGECESLRSAILSGRTVERETKRKAKDGSQIPVSLIGCPVSVEGKHYGIYYIYQDISERKAFEQQITHQAFHDSLTGLANRSLFNERLTQALQRRSRRKDYNFSVLLLDLDRFKQVNDTLGHQVGDMLLLEVARRIKDCVRSIDTVARLGGDEFAVLLEELQSQSRALHIAKRLAKAVAEPLDLGNSCVSTGASIGLVLHTNDYALPEDIMRDADIAMYRAKNSGKDIKVFDESMRQELFESLGLENDLRQAVENGELKLHYQPIYDARTCTLSGFEALVRWAHPVRGMIAPDRFIPLAEETGIILNLGRWVLKEALTQLSEWRKSVPGSEELVVNVNVSSKQLAKPGLYEYLLEVLKDTAVPPTRLKLEITESVLMQNLENIVFELNRFKALGVGIAIDDFGTGYSSLNYLRRLPIDSLKIDRSFISGEEENDEGMQIVRSIVSLARNLGLDVVAEGVESGEQLERLIDADCDSVQGYMFSRPLDAGSSGALLKKIFSAKVE